MKNRFVKIETKNTKEEIAIKFSAATDESNSQLKKLYCSIRYAEFTENGYECMYAEVTDESLEKLINSFLDYEIIFNVIEFTDYILMNEFPKVDEFHANLRLKLIIGMFLDDNLTVDTVLDKINSRGIDSLNNFDKSVLGIKY